MSHIFISYVVEDGGDVKEFVARLTAAGYSRWYDSEALRRNHAEWPTNSEQAIRNSHVVVFFASPAAVTSEEVVYELGYARAREIKIVPVLLAPTDSVWVGDDYVDLTQRTPDDMQKVIDRLGEREDDEWQFDIPERFLAKSNGRHENPSDGFLEGQGFALPQPTVEDNMTFRLELDDALRKLKNGSSMRDRLDAAIWLADSADPRAVQALIETLDDKSIAVRVRKASAEALGMIKNPQAVANLVSVLCESDADTDLREAAANALGQIKHPSAVDCLIDILTSDTEIFVRLAAAKALGSIGDPQALPYLINIMRKAPWRLRRAAVLAIGDIGDVSAYADLLVVIEDDDEEVRRDAALVIVKLLGPRGLNQALFDRGWRTREAAAWALGETRAPEVVPELISLLDDEEVAVRQSVVWALGAIGDPRAVPDLLQTLQLDKNARVLWYAAWALGAIGHTDAVPALVQLLGGSDESMHEVAAKSLGKIGHPDAVPSLRATILNHPQAGVRLAATEAILQIRASSVIEVLDKALEDEDVDVSRAAARGLRSIGTPDALEVLDRWRGRR